MKIKNYITGSVLFLAMLGCVTPGLVQPDVIPAFDLNTIPTMVGLTANAAMTQTAVVASSTPTLMSTESITATPRVSLSGTSLLLRDDQTTVFTDRKAGIEFIIPAGWMPFRVNEQEYYDAFVSSAATDPAIYNRLVRIQRADPARYRLNAIDVRSGHVFNGIITVIDCVFKEDDVRGLEEISEDWRNYRKPYAGYKLISSDYEQTANGMKLLIIEEKWNAPTGITYYRGSFFKTSSGLVRFDLFVNNDFKDIILLDLESVIDSVTLLNT